MSRWEALTGRLLEEVEHAEPIYRPTTFWGPGVQAILDDIAERGLETFKSWPSARTWFYPRYGTGLTATTINAALRAAVRMDRDVLAPWFRAALNGAQYARRDFDAARLAWDQARWPFDLDGLGESEVGAPPQAFRLGQTDAQWTRPYLNYLLCLAGLSRHVDGPPRRFLELGGGYGVLGEIVLSRDADATYLDLDLPPLLTVASAYLDRLFGDRVTTYEALPPSGALRADGSACLPNWRIRDLQGSFDVFVNSFSFQEMEPDVVENYAADVASHEVTWVVSLNSRSGKPRRAEDNPIGVVEPVLSRNIVAAFERHGYRSVATYNQPLLQSQGELAILRRRNTRARSAGRGTAGGRATTPLQPGTPGAGAPPSATFDLRLPIERTSGDRVGAVRRRRRIRRIARRLPGWMLDALRAVRRRLRR